MLFSKRQFWAGIALVLLVSSAAMALDATGWVSSWGFSTLTLAIILGMLLGNTLYPNIAQYCHDGVMFSKNRILRISIVLYGFRLTLQQISGVGLASIAIDAVMLSTTFILAYQLGQRWLKMDVETALLIGAGSSICGAAAVMAAEPVLKSSTAKVSVAVATVVVFGTIGIFLYPQMYTWGVWPLNATHYGIYIGSTIHEVAQVVAAGKAINTEVADIAVTTKMIRVMMLAPVLLVLATWWQRKQHVQKHTKAKINIPWFAFGFIAVVLFNSLQWLPTGLLHHLIQLDTVLLTMAMAALGLTTHLGAVRQAGPKPLFLGLALMAWLVVGGGLLQSAFYRLFA